MWCRGARASASGNTLIHEFAANENGRAFAAEYFGRHLLHEYKIFDGFLCRFDKVRKPRITSTVNNNGSQTKQIVTVKFFF